jgi:hypothetical protein
MPVAAVRDGFTKADGDPDRGFPGVFPAGAADPRPLARSVEIDLPGSCPIKVRVYSVRGELIRVLFDGRLSAGHHSVLWDGTSERGLPVEPGLYFCRLESPTFSESRKLLVLRCDAPARRWHRSCSTLVSEI